MSHTSLILHSKAHRKNSFAKGEKKTDLMFTSFRSHSRGKEKTFNQIQMAIYRKIMIPNEKETPNTENYDRS